MNTNIKTFPKIIYTTFFKASRFFLKKTITQPYKYYKKIFQG